MHETRANANGVLRILLYQRGLRDTLPLCLREELLSVLCISAPLEVFPNTAKCTQTELHPSCMPEPTVST